MNGTNRIFFITMFLVSFALRCAVFVSGTENLSVVTCPDEKNFYLAAAELIQNEGIVAFFGSERSLWNGPVNPLWIAVFGSNVVLIKFLNLFCMSFATALFSVGIAQLWGVRIGAVAGASFLFYYPTYVFGPTLLTEPLYLSFILSSLGVLLYNIRSDKHWILSGLLLGIATLVRPTTQLVPLACILIGTVLWLSSRNRKIFLLGISAFFVLAPVILHNYLEFNKLGIANGSGAVLYLGNDLRRNGDEPVYYGVDFDSYQHSAPFTHLDTEGDRRLTAVAKERIKAHPKDIFYLTLEKAVRYVFGSGSGYFYPAKNIFAYRNFVGFFEYSLHVWWAFLQILVSLLGLIGIVVALRSTDSGIKTLGIYIGLLTAYFIFLHSITFPIPRLALPLFPFLLVGVAATLALKKWRWRDALIVIVVFVSASGFITMRSAPHFYTEAKIEEISYYEKNQTSTLIAVSDVKLNGNVPSVISQIGKEDPFYIFGFSPILLLRNQVVSLNYKVVCPEKSMDTKDEGSGQLFWATKEQPYVEEARSIQFPLRAHNGNHILRPALNSLWKGELTQLRFDFPKNFSGCELQELKLAVLE